MTNIITRNRVRAIITGAVSLGLTLFAVTAQAQAPAVISGSVKTDEGRPIESANVYITEMAVSVATNALGIYTATIPAARVSGQKVNRRVRAIGQQNQFVVATITPGSQTKNFIMKQDVNRLSEVVVTGSIEGTERSKVPFAIGRITEEEIPVPAM